MRKLFLLVLLFGFLGAATVPGTAAAQGTPGELSIGWPAASMSADNPVPLETVKAVALKKAREMWGQVIAGEPIPCADQDGNLAYYMVPFKFGAGPFPTYEQIMEGVKKGRELVGEVQKGLTPPELMVSLSESPQPGNIILHSNPDVPKSKKPQTQAGSADSVPSYQKLFKAARSKEMGIGEYGTVFVAATYDRFPIPLFTNYLAPCYLTGDLAQEKAGSLLGGEPILNRIYFLGERGTYFEFISGGNTVTIHAFTLESEPIKRVERRAATIEYQERLKMEWNNLSQ